MIRCSVSYPRVDGKKFDFEYYRNSHMPMVKDRLSPVKIEIDAGLPNPQGEPSPFFAVGHMTFETLEQLMERFGPAAGELLADIPNYTDQEPIIQISEIIEI